MKYSLGVSAKFKRFHPIHDNDGDDDDDEEEEKEEEDEEETVEDVWIYEWMVVRRWW